MMFNSSSSGIPYYSRYSRYGYRYPYYTYKSYSNPYSNKGYDSVTQNMHSSSTLNNTPLKFSDNSYRKNIINNMANSGINNKNHNSTNYDFNYKCNCDKKSEARSNENEDSPLFQLFGINLYFDDILLVCLIFFLYQEGVKDEGLFISLILLLLS
ncbi:MAG: hypothetical protein HFJ57_05235 [Clostridia bacterium]|nr:hypothetical protein [Clostridia bacterium]